MLISPAYAQAAAATTTSPLDQLQSFAPIILIVVVFYLLLLRPQARKAKQHKELVSNLRRGDRVVTSGGLIGQVSKVVNENELQLELADGVRVRLLRTAVTDVLAKTEPVGGKSVTPEGVGPSDGDDAGKSAAPASGGTLLGKLLGRK